MKRDNLSIRPMVRILCQLCVAAGILAQASALAQDAPALPSQNLRLWLKADAGVTSDASGLVSQWADQSGHPYGATQSGSYRPTLVANVLNGRPVVRFGAGKFLNLPNFMSGAAEADGFIVAMTDPSITQGLWNIGSYNDRNYYPYGQASIYENFGSTARFVSGLPAVSLKTYHLYNVSAKTGSWTARQNGRTFCSSTSTAIGFRSNPVLGADYPDGASCFRGDIAEVIVYDHVLSDADREAVGKYIASKYGFISAPDAPASLMATALSNTQVSLAWISDAGNGARFYDVERKADGEEGFALVATVADRMDFQDNLAAAGTGYTYRVRARSYAGASGYSNEAEVTTPTMVTTGLPTLGLRLWLKADAGLAAGGVAGWADQSGHPYSATQSSNGNCPTMVANVLNGRPVVRFGSGRSLKLPNFMSGGAAGDGFIVAMTDPSITQGLWNMGSSSDRNYYPYGQATIYDNFGSTVLHSVALPAVGLNVYHLYNVSAGTGAWVARQNGRTIGSSAANTVGFRSDPILGADYPDASSCFRGDIAEVIIYDRVLADAEREAVGKYIASKYGFILSPNIPANLVARAFGATQVSLAWINDAGNGTHFYDVERKADGEAEFSRVVTVADCMDYQDNSVVAGTGYTYRVRARSYAGSSGYSNEAEVTTPAAATAGLPSQGLRLWLKADAGLTAGGVAGWADQSGHSNDATQGAGGNRPTMVANALNGRPVVRFGSGKFLNLPNFMTGATEADGFVVVMTDPSITQGLWNIGSCNDRNYYPNGQLAIYDNFGSTVRYSFAPPAVGLNTYHLYNVSAKAGSWTARQNGRTFFSHAANIVGFRPNPVLGADYPDAASCFRGDIAEVMVFDRVLTDAEREAVGGYLAMKYGFILAPDTPANLTATAYSNTQVNLTWINDAGNGTQFYDVERKAAGEEGFTLVATVVDSMGYQDNSVLAGTGYTYRIRNRNYAGTSGYSNEADVTTPTVVTTGLPSQGLRLWLKADAGLTAGGVAGWPDQSGRGNDATQGTSGGRPTMVANVLNGRPVVRFGSGKYLNLPNFMTGATEADGFVVVMTDPSLTQGLWNIGSRNDRNYYPNGQSVIYDNFGSTVRYSFALPAISLKTYHLYNVSAKAGLWTARQNGRAFYSSTSNAIGFRSDPVLGADYPDASSCFRGDVAEVMIYDHVLTDDERAAVQLYLYRKYNFGLETLTLLPAAGFFTSPVAVTMASPTGNAEIYYTVDGTAPVRGVSPLYTGPIAIAQSTRVRAQAFVGATSSSNEASGLYLIGQPQEPVTALSGLAATYFQGAGFSGSSTRRIETLINAPDLSTLPAGWQGASVTARYDGELIARFTENHTFTLNTNGGVRLWFGNDLVIDGWSDAGSRALAFARPLVAGTHYPLRLEFQRKGSAAIELRLQWSGFSTGQQVIPQSQLFSGLGTPNFAGTPAASPAAGLYADSVAVALSTGVPANGAAIYYTLDGTDPDASSALYTTPIALKTDTTLKARAYAAGFNESGVLVAAYTLSHVPPALSNLTFNGGPVPAPITTNGTFGITANSSVGVQRVEFRLDGQLIGTSTVAAAGFTAPFSIDSVSDGPHTLTAQAWDNAGKPSDVFTAAIQVALPPPPPPQITSPADGKRVNQPALTVRGVAAKLATVRLYRGAVMIGSAAAAADGSFAIAITLEAGADALSATAQNRCPQPSAPSSVVNVTYDNTVPAPPTALSARAVSGGRISLAWYPPASGLASGYYLFRSNAPIPADAPLTLASAVGPMIRGQGYTDTPPSDGRQYYRVVTAYLVGDAATLSEPSNQADAVSDATPPSATASLQAMGPFYDAAGHRFGVGLVQATLTVSETLGATPFFNLAIAGGAPVFVDLTPQGNNVYQGVFSITASTSSGAVTPVFSAIDAAGNRGTTVTLTTPAVIDTLGPKVTGLVPVRITESGSLEDLPKLDAIKNDPAPSVTAVSVSWRVVLDEAPKPGTSPLITATLSGDPDHPLTLAVSRIASDDTNAWLAQLELPAGAGAETEDLTLHFAASDDLGNPGEDILPPHVFQVYKGDLPPLAVPGGFTTVALPAGAIQLTWQTVPGAVAYEIQVRGPGETDFHELLMSAADATDYRYTPAADGSYSYRVASVRTANGQNAVSGWSPVVTAVSDRVPPDAPANLLLEVVPQGLKATWNPPAVRAGEIAGYALYRSNAAITSVAGLTPVLAQIPAASTVAVDPRPDGTQPFYALVAFDLAGNQSLPVAAFANVSLLPVRSLAVTQMESGAPVLTWEKAPGSVIDGYNLLVGDVPISLGGSILIPVGTVTYTDAAYAGGDRRYTVKTVSGPDNRERSIALPNMELTLDAGAEIKRGLMNTLLVSIRNLSAQPLTDARLMVQVAGRNHYAADLVTVAAGAEVPVPIVVGGYDDLPVGAAPVGLTIVVSPNEGESATLQRSASVQVTEGALAVEVLPGEFTRGGSGSVRFKLTNPSSLPIELKVARQQGSQASDEVRVKLLDTQGAILSSTPLQIVLGDDVVALPDGTTILRIPAGAAYTSPTISVPVPSAAPAQVDVSLEVDSVYYHFGQGDTQVQLKGPQARQQASTVETAYRAEVTSVAPAESNGDQAIVIQGRALWRGLDPSSPAAPAAGVKVVVTLALDGFIRQNTVLTGPDGLFTYTFQPGAAEKGGVYQVWAAHPDVTQPPDSPATFTIRRVNVSPQVFNVRVPRNYRQVLPVQVSTGAGATVHNLRAVLAEPLPPAVSYDTVPVETLAAAQTITLPLSVIGLAATSESTDVGTLHFHVVSDDGAGGEFTWADLTVNYTFSAAQPYLQATPNLTQIGVQPGQIASDTVVLKNVGLASLEDATLGLVGADSTALPAWIRLQTPAALGTIDIGSEQSVIISAAPPNSGQLIDEIYHLYLHVQGGNGSAQDFPVSVTVSPAGKGGALFKIIDPYFQLTLPDGAANAAINGLPGASVVLEKESSTGVPTVTQSATTDANGEAAFNDLPAGWYKLRINADRHEPQTSRIAIKPGVIYADQIALVYNAVTFTWEVVPVTFQDRYDVVLTATYETNVPVPVVVIEPAAINLPKMCAGQVFTGEFRITNHGLIDAHDVKVPVPASDEYFSYELLTDFGDTVKAGQTVTVAYRVKCLKPLPGACPETADNSSRSENLNPAVEALVARSGERQQADAASTAESRLKGLIATIDSGIGPGGGSAAGGGTVVTGLSSPLSGSSSHSMSACAPSGTGVSPVSGVWPIRDGSGGRMRVSPVGMGSVLLAACALVFVVRRRRGAVQSCYGRIILNSAVEASAPCSGERQQADSAPTAGFSLIRAVRVVLVAELGFALPPAAVAGVASGGSYDASSVVTYIYTTGCGQSYVGSVAVHFCCVSGSSSNNGAGGPAKPMPWGGGTGFGGSLNSWNPGNLGGSSDSSDDCHPAPANNACSPSGGNPDDKKDCNHPAQRSQCQGVYQAGGSWIDLVRRRFRDNATDLMVPVPGGEVAVWRDFDYGRWTFRMIDDLYALSTAEGKGIYLNGEVYRDATNSSSNAVVGFVSGFASARSSAQSTPQPQPVAIMPAGTYLVYGVGPAKLAKNADGTLLWSDGSGNERLYNSSGLLVARQYRGQLIAAYHYDASSLLDKIADRDGRTVLTFTYAGGQLTGVRDFSGRTVTYGHDTEGRLASVTDPLGTQTTYAYDNAWHMTGKRTHLDGTPAAADHQVTITYQGRVPDVATAPFMRMNQFTPGFVDPASVRSVTHNTGECETFVFKYNSGDQTYYAQVTDATGKVDESVFDATGALIAKSVNGDQVYKMEQDATTRVTTRGGNQTTTEEFDAQGYLLRRIQPDGGIELFEYDRNLSRLTRHTDPVGVVTAYDYDSLGNELSRTEAVGSALERVITSEYYPGTTLLKRETDPSGRARAYEYDAADRVTRMYDPANPADQTTYTYDALGDRESETDALSRVTIYHYDALGHVIERIDPLKQQTLFGYSGDRLVEMQTGRTATAPGRVVRYEYDSAGRKIKEKRVDSGGAEQVFKTFAYDADGRLATETNAVGQGATYGYDAAGNQSSISIPDTTGAPSTTRSTYDPLGRPVAIVDAAGTTRTTEYDLRDRPVVATEAAGTPAERTVRTRYDLLGHAVEIKQSDAREPARVYATTCTYDALGRRTSVGGDRAYPVAYAFDAADRVVRETDALGRVKSCEYDSSGRILAVRLDGTLIASCTYDLVGNRLSATDGEGNHRHFHYDALDRLTHESIPLPSSQAMPDGWWTQPALVLRQADYDPWSEVTSVTTYTAAGSGTGASLAATTTYAYDVFGRKVGDTDTAGLTRTFSYDAADNLLSVAYPPVPSAGEAQGTSDLYLRSPNNAGVFVATVDRAGNRTSYGYDGALRIVSETNSLGGVTSRTFDALGRVATQTDPAGNTTSYAYDLFDQPVQIIYPDHVAGTHERIETFRYDNHGKLVEKAGAGDYPMSYAYDAVGNLVSLTDGNQHTTRWSYNSSNLVETKTYADGTSYGYTYDGAGRVKTRRDVLGRITTYGYDANGLPASIGYPTDPAVTFAYDQQGRRLSMADGSGTTTWTYDSAGRPLTETQGRSGRTLRFSYDFNSQRTGLEVDGGSTTWTTGYGYDNAGRLRTVLDDRLAAGRPYVYTYASNASLVTQLATPTGLKTVKTYDNLGRLLSTAGQQADNTVFTSFGYSYDAAGQRVTESAPERTRAFTYDAWRQLTQSAATSADPQLAITDGYSYDGIGNRTQVTRAAASAPSGTTLYTANPVNQYASILNPGSSTPDSPAYDLNGNTVGCASALRSLGEGGESLTLRYDEENRLVEASDTAHRSLYVYDGLGRRVAQQDFSWNPALGTWRLERDARFVYDGWQVIEETDASGQSLRSYTRGLDLSGSPEGAGGIGGLLAITAGGATPSSRITASYFYDGNGNVTDLINDDGASAAHYTYSPFGDRLSATGPLADLNPYQFSSKERDPLTGFYYYGFRFYHPTTGRWLSRDPMEEDGGVNLYNTLDNDIPDGIDPCGLVLYAVGGTNSVTDNNTTNFQTHIYRFFKDWRGPGKADYSDGPGSSALLGYNAGNIAGYGVSDLVEKGYQFVCHQLQKQRNSQKSWLNDPIFLVGHSRGGLVVMNIAKKLKEGCPCDKKTNAPAIEGSIPVYFVGLYDAVSMDMNSPAEPVSENVENVVHGIRDPGLRSRAGWGNTGTSGGQEYVSEVFWGNHSAMGGDPAEGDQLNVVSLAQNTKASIAIDKYIRGEARNHGAQLGGR